MVAKDHILGVRPARILALTILGYLISSVASAEESVAPVASPLKASVPNSEAGKSCGCRKRASIGIHSLRSKWKHETSA